MKISHNDFLHYLEELTKIDIDLTDYMLQCVKLNQRKKHIVNEMLNFSYKTLYQTTKEKKK